MLRLHSYDQHMSIFKEHRKCVVCKKCNREFFVKPSYAKRAKYCSKTCSSSVSRGNYKKKIKTECPNCHVITERLPSHRNSKYCSVQCRGEASRKERITGNCKLCGKVIVDKPRTLKSYCSRGCSHKSASSGESLLKTKETNLKRYGVAFVSQLSDIKQKKHSSMKKNGTYAKISKFESRVHKILNALYLDVKSQVLINNWSVDFYIESIKTYLQVDGTYWHGLDRPEEKLRESKSPRDNYILQVKRRDEEQNTWFQTNNIKLARIDDSLAKKHDDDIVIYLRYILENK